MILWLYDDRGRRFASMRAASPKGILGLARMQAMSVEMVE